MRPCSRDTMGFSSRCGLWSLGLEVIGNSPSLCVSSGFVSTRASDIDILYVHLRRLGSLEGD